MLYPLLRKIPYVSMRKKREQRRLFPSSSKMAKKGKKMLKNLHNIHSQTQPGAYEMLRGHKRHECSHILITCDSFLGNWKQMKFKVFICIPLIIKWFKKWKNLSFLEEFMDTLLSGPFAMLPPLPILFFLRDARGRCLLRPSRKIQSPKSCLQTFLPLCCKHRCLVIL